MHSMWPLLAIVPTTFANFDTFFFARNGSCPDLGYNCGPPGVCSFDALLNKYYCCTGESQDICWTSGQTCGGANTSVTSSQSTCQTADGTWCCLKGSEQCTQQYGQSYICWSTQRDVLGQASSGQLNSLYRSLTSASPTATYLTFDATSFAKAATAQTSTTATTTTTGSTSSSKNRHSSTSLSGGTIAGIVVGAVAAILTLFVAIAILYRRKRRRGYGDRSNPWPDAARQQEATDAMPYQDHKYGGPQNTVNGGCQYISQEIEGAPKLEAPTSSAGESYELYTPPAELSESSTPLFTELSTR